MIHLAILVLLGAPITGTGPGPDDGHTLSGVVTDSTGTPLPEARISISEARRFTTTNADGRYELAGLADGTYTVSYALVGFGPQLVRVVISGKNVVQNVVLKQSLIELPELQATATPTATSALESPQPVSVLSGEDLHAAQSSSLGATLDGMAGVHNYSTGVGIGKPVIRGLTSNRVLVLDNGQRLETQQWGDEHGPNVETATADRVEVIRGPASVLYGSDALGGVINVVQAPLPNAVDKKAYGGGSIGLGYGTNNSQPDASLLLEGATGRWGFRGTASGRTSSDLQTPDYTLWNSGNQAVGGSASAGYNANWGTLAATWSQRNEKVQITEEDPTDTPRQEIISGRGRLEGQFPVGGSHIDALVTYERNKRSEFEDATTEEVATGLFSQTWLADAKLHKTIGKNIAGVLGLTGFTTWFQKYGEETLIPENHSNTAGVYAFAQSDLDRWQLSGGLRFDYRHLVVDEDTVLGNPAATHNYPSIVGNIGALYRVSQPVALVLNVGSGFRAPSVYDLYANGVHEGSLAYDKGDPDLTNEQSLNTDLAVRFQGPNLAFEIGGFVNLISNFIYSVPVPGEIDPGSGFQVYQTTQGNSMLTGFEASAKWHPYSFLHLQGTADYVWGQNTSLEQPLPNMPPFRATWSIQVEAKGSSLFAGPYANFSGEVNAQQTRLNPDELAYYATAFDGAGFTPMAYALLNLGAGVSIMGGPDPVHLDLTLKNLLDTAYAPQLSRNKTVAPLPGMGRTLLIGISMNFGTM